MALLPLLKVTSAEARKMVNFPTTNEHGVEEKLDFIKRTLGKVPAGRLAYNEVFRDCCLAQYDVVLNGRNGLSYGCNVTIYMKCSHGRFFNLIIAKELMVPDIDLQFKVSAPMMKNPVDCQCCKFSAFNLNKFSHKFLLSAFGGYFKKSDSKPMVEKVTTEPKAELRHQTPSPPRNQKRSDQFETPKRGIKFIKYAQKFGSL